MPEPVPPKNVDPVLADIKRPGRRYDPHSHRKVVHLERAPQRPLPRFRRLRRALGALTVAGTVILIGGGLVVAGNVQEVRDRLAGTGSVIVDNFMRSFDALGRLDPEAASQHLTENRDAFVSLEHFLDERNVNAFLDLAGGMIPVAREGRNLLDQVAGLNQQFLELSERLAALKQYGFRYFQTDGSRLLELVRETRERIASIRTRTGEVKNTTASLRNVSAFFANLDETLGDHYVKRGAELAGLERFLGGVVSFLESEEPRHFLLFFENPAELRPGGGFIGSYADLVIQKGQLVSMDVRDIYDPDGQLTAAVVPPLQLRTVTEQWGARDANWFFDFPTSARTVIGFLEQSLMYRERNIRFDGALALNINVFRSILETVGPIVLPEYDLTIEPGTFLEHLQREVEAGKDREAGEPKRILKVLTPTVLQRLGDLDAGRQSALFARLETHLAKKDLMFFARDPALADFFNASNLDGAVYELPNGFWGSYLAVVNANVAGGKSDAFVEELIDARIDVDTAGGVLTDLSVTRTHRGNKEKDPWWRATNQNYIQVFANPNATLVALSGNDVKTLSPVAAPGFVVHPTLESLEANTLFSSAYKAWIGSAFGKTVFGTWLNIPAGKQKTLEVRYQVPERPDVAPEQGMRFSFIFDRQSGVSTTLKLAILAPVGYLWSESRGPTYTALLPDPDRRVRVDLTLVR
ncbi:MAG: DUF4012 domain-containing protein [Patescibacteria group bacterium]